MRLLRLLSLLVLSAGLASPAFAQDEAPKPKPKKKPAKTYDYDRSKYKSRELAEGEIKTYRFNEKGEAVVPGAKKKKAPAKGKSKLEPPEEAPVERGCSEAKPCKSPDEADAL
ncbi:MAG: hypothetical protein SF051_04985 [Elusimicrobiota bacterium]|nr:hypothetical protein [Elusimicrobiota bacterium]